MSSGANLICLLNGKDILMRLTILFDPPYWIGLLEAESDSLLYAARHIFGSEPSDAEVYAFVQNDLLDLMQSMTVGLPIDSSSTPHRINPKRQQRIIRREVLRTDVPSKAHEAIRLQIEANAQERLTINRSQRDQKRQHKRDLAAAKAKAKHKGH
jgi:hypothetical protein